MINIIFNDKNGIPHMIEVSSVEVINAMNYASNTALYYGETLQEILDKNPVVIDNPDGTSESLKIYDFNYDEDRERFNNDQLENAPQEQPKEKDDLPFTAYQQKMMERSAKFSFKEPEREPQNEPVSLDSL